MFKPLTEQDVIDYLRDNAHLLYAYSSHSRLSDSHLFHLCEDPDGRYGVIPERRFMVVSRKLADSLNELIKEINSLDGAVDIDFIPCDYARGLYGSVYNISTENGMKCRRPHKFKDHADYLNLVESIKQQFGYDSLVAAQETKLIEWENSLVDRLSSLRRLRLPVEHKKVSFTDKDTYSWGDI